MSMIDELRGAIEAKHTEALKALEILKGYLDSELPSNGLARKGTKKPPKYPTGSIRDKVVKALSGAARTIRDVADETKLAPKQIRGVVGAPDLKEFFGSEERDGVMYYRYTPGKGESQ